jgi:hypothetical protein
MGHAIGRLSELVYAAFGPTLAGTIPTQIGNLKSLKFLHADETRLSGTLPATLCGAPLQTISIHNGQLSERGADSLLGCRVLESLDLDNNSLTRLPPPLPKSLTHLYLNSNPINATAFELAALLAPLENLRLVDIGVLNIGADLKSTQIRKPDDCQIGATSSCFFQLTFEDMSHSVIRGDNLITGLTIGYDCLERKTANFWNDTIIHRSNCSQTAPMVQGGHGTFIATLPPAWIDRKGPHTFAFFHEGVEFHPFLLYPGSSSDDVEIGSPSLRTAYYKPRVCYGSHTSPDLETGSRCVCDLGFEPNTGVSQSLLECHKVCDNDSGMAISLDGLRCECAGDSYDAGLMGTFICIADSWVSDMIAPIRFSQANRHDRCRSCPDECATCSNGRLSLRPGWRLNGSTTAEIDAIVKRGNGGLVQFAFKCQGAETDHLCPAIDVLSLSSEEYFQPSNRTNGINGSIACPGRQIGRLCGGCKPGSTRGHGSVVCNNNCTKDWSFMQRDLERLGLSPPLFICLITATIVLVTLAAYILHHFGFIKSILNAKKDINTHLKIMLGLVQVLTLLSEMLDVLFPPQPQAAMETMSVFTLDIHRLVQLDCWGYDWYIRWLTTVIIVPLTLLALVACQYGVERARNKKHPDKIAQAAIEKAFFVVILLYPKVSAKIFTILRCRWLGPVAGVLEADYSISCDTLEYEHYHTLALLLVLVIPIGVPTLLLALLLRSAQHHRLRFNSRSVQQVGNMFSRPVPRKAEGEKHRQEEAEYVYEKLQKTYAFCTKDYRPDTFWFEPVDMYRKLALTGLLQFVPRGSAAQTLCGCALSFNCFTLQTQLRPYKEPETNLLKTLVDVQIFSTFLICFILRFLSNPAFAQGEPLGAVTYGWVLMVGLVLVMFSGIGLTARQHLRKKQDLATLNILDPRSERPPVNPTLHDIGSGSQQQIDFDAQMHDADDEGIFPPGSRNTLDPRIWLSTTFWKKSSRLEVQLQPVGTGL